MRNSALVSVLVVLGFVGIASARDWYVDPSAGVDSNDGSPGRPLATIAGAVDRAERGDRIVLMPENATYEQSISIGGDTESLLIEGNGVRLVPKEGGTADGITISGSARNIEIRGLRIEGFGGDGIRVEGNARGIRINAVSSLDNGGAGISVSDAASCWTRNSVFSGNAIAASDSGGSDSYYDQCRFEAQEGTLLRFRGGRRSVDGCTVAGASDLVVLDVAGSGEGVGAESASLVIRGLSIATGGGRAELGPASSVFVDPETAGAFAMLALTKQPTAVLSEELYQVEPIGRDETGEPIFAWSGGGSPLPRRGSYRLLHLGLHAPSRIAKDLNPRSDWLGLMEPLPDAIYPPVGSAFEPENSAAHAVWRWIGLSAPDAVFVPDTETGRLIAEALREHPPAGIGMIDVFLSEGQDTPDPLTTPFFRADEEASAKTGMLRRTERSPRELLEALSTHYGNQFGGSYIDALAVIAKRRAGIPVNIESMAGSRRGDELPRNAGVLAGTLLFAETGVPEDTRRLVAVASLGFDGDGEPRESMPHHSEMSDALFMGGPLLARAGEATGETRYFDQCVRQVRFVQELCLRDDGLYRHSPLCEAAWGRGNGFPALGLAMILDHFPADHPEREFLERAATSHLETLSQHQGNDGMWHQLIDRPDSYGEFTCTAMIAYAIARGIRTGRLDAGSWEPRLQRAWEGIAARVSLDGSSFVNACESTGKQQTAEDYYRRKAILGPDPRSGAMALLLSGELAGWERQVR